MATLASGVTNQTLRHPVVSLVLTGQKNLESMRNSKERKPARRAMTLPLMLLLGHRLSQSGWSEHKKQLIWTVALTALFGSFRIGELLSKSADSFDSRFTLLRRDVTHINGPVEMIRVFIKSPKVRVGVGDEVEVFALNSTYCPVKAAKRYMAMAESAKFDPELPFFRQESGANYGKDLFNRDLKTLLKDDIDYAGGETISSHSFRAAIPSHMAQWGYSETDIQGWGRWSSQAYKKYCKLPVLTRRQLAQKLQEKLEQQISSQ